MNIAQNLERAVRLFSDDMVVVFDGRTLTYLELAERVNRTAHERVRFGVDTGNRFALFLSNVPEFAITNAYRQILHTRLNRTASVEQLTIDGCPAVRIIEAEEGVDFRLFPAPGSHWSKLGAERYPRGFPLEDCGTARPARA